MLIDTHCHLNFGAYNNDRDEIVKKTLEAGIWMINVGSQSATSEKAVKIANSYDSGVFAAVGLHPTHLFEMEVDEEEAGTSFKSRKEDWDHEFYRNLAKNKKVVAIGEIGLDYNFIPKNIDLKAAKQKQQEVFKEGLELADELSLPVIIHSRDTHNDIIPILKTYLDAGRLKRRGVLHCFTGSWEEAQRYLELGFLISFTGIITFNPRPSQAKAQEKILEVVKNIPLEKCMIETDAPYLTPEPYRGKRNEPLYVEFVARKIGEIKQMDFNEVAEVTAKTAKYFFSLS
ncbi:MAG: TatD family hydrolase [Patescibacteria group bacterium]